MSAEYTITKEQILKMAKVCPTAKSVLKAGFPDAFEVKEEWEDITQGPDVRLGTEGGRLSISLLDNGTWASHVWFLGTTPNRTKWAMSDENRFNCSRCYKIENGKILRRK